MVDEEMGDIEGAADEADVEDAEAMEGTTGTARTRMSSSHRGDSTSCSRC